MSTSRRIESLSKIPAPRSAIAASSQPHEMGTGPPAPAPPRPACVSSAARFASSPNMAFRTSPWRTLLRPRMWARELSSITSSPKTNVLGRHGGDSAWKVREAAASAARNKLPIYAVLRRLARRLAEEPGRSPGLARAFISSFLTSPSVREILKRICRRGVKQ